MWVHNRRAGVKLMIEVERLRERGTEEMWRLCSVARLSAHAEKCNQKTNRKQTKKANRFQTGRIRTDLSVLLCRRHVVNGSSASSTGTDFWTAIDCATSNDPSFRGNRSCDRLARATDDRVPGPISSPVPGPTPNPTTPCWSGSGASSGCCSPSSGSQSHRSSPVATWTGCCANETASGKCHHAPDCGSGCAIFRCVSWPRQRWVSSCDRHRCGCGWTKSGTKTSWAIDANGSGTCAPCGLWKGARHEA